MQNTQIRTFARRHTHTRAQEVLKRNADVQVQKENNHLVIHVQIHKMAAKIYHAEMTSNSKKDTNTVST